MDLRTHLEHASPVEAAALVLGQKITCGTVTARIVEVEAYGGQPGSNWPDPASHAYRGRTQRNFVMFGPPGHLYVYRIYGVHLCMNVTFGSEGHGGGVLLRAGEIVAGTAMAQSRRPAARNARDVASGPGNFACALGITPDLQGSDVCDPASPVRLDVAEPVRKIAYGPRVGVRHAASTPWRLWVDGHASVSRYRRHPKADTLQN
ncbi:DNA-3-methyladenine glycosylase [Hoyosella rhizosphaerae]|uniref:DNA-3-methyladenine glycosylase n=1 Tax=Hoyosella rhizosphaerae TaxID=1755582 RepID=UPI00166832D5|nr:DNA-3-methyladenine glycosylase [Hoyosella rhizosphaerae]MBN4925488.1 DNA-3-methyladenine glycosylase [Hoyosella rhizosphaerae]